MTISQDAPAGSIRQLLDAQGIDTLDALVARFVADGPEPSEEPLFAMRAAPATDTAPAVVHRPPRVPLFVDGDAYDPSRISDFDGRPLYSTPGVTPDGAPALHSFTGQDGLVDHLSRTVETEKSAAGSDDIGTSNPDSLSTLALYYSDDSARGDHLQNGPGKAWRDLTKVRRGILHLGDWNDVISSVNWCRWDISLYEHTNYGGAQLYLQAGRTYFHLSEFGWNDRASATVNWGRRF